MKNRRIISILTAIFFSSLLLLTLNVSAETTVNYTIYPEEPTPQSDVTITAVIDDITITSVYLEMQECAGDVCFGWDTNVSMNPTGEENTYNAVTSLEHEDATYFSLRVVIERDETWETTTGYKVNIDLSDPGNGDNDNGDNTPGFEMILLFIAILAGVILYGRKRL